MTPPRLTCSGDDVLCGQATAVRIERLVVDEVVHDVRFWSTAVESCEASRIGYRGLSLPS